MVQNRAYDNTAAPAAGTTAVNFNTDYDYGGSEGFQTGSAYKVFDLLEWLQEGHSLYQTVSGTQHLFPQSSFHESDPCNDIGGAPWPVSNDEGESVGSTTVMNATAQSINTIFAKMATQLDLCGIKQRAQDLLVHGADEAANPLRANPSSVLGTNYIAPLTMATAYAGIANNGVACSPVAIDKIVTGDGTQHAVPKSTCSKTPIDPGVARLAAGRISDADIERLRQLVAAQQDLVFDPLSFRASDLRFHTLIMEATGNSFMVRTSSSLYLLGFEYRRIASETPGVLRQSLADHEAIVAALEQRDGEAAARAVERHLRNVHRSTVDAMEDDK